MDNFFFIDPQIWFRELGKTSRVDLVHVEDNEEELREISLQDIWSCPLSGVQMVAYVF